MFENDTNHRESWILHNNTNRRFSIGDLNTLPCLEPNKSLDLLRYCTKDQIGNSANLSSMVKSGLVSIDKRYKSDIVPVPTTPLNVDEAITPAEHDLASPITKQDVIDTGITLNEIDGVLSIVKGGTNNVNYVQDKFLIYDGTSIDASLYDQNSFSLTSHNHDSTYLKLTGGTVSGTLVLGTDIPAGNPNVPGSLKFWSAGDNAFYTTFTATTQSNNADYLLPISLPAAIGFLKSSNLGALSWDTSVYLTSYTETDTLSSVTGRGALTPTTIQFQNALAAEFGKDVAGGNPNVAGSIKLWSAGDNAWSTTFTAGSQGADASYILPTSSATGLLKNTTGTLSWDASAYLTGVTVDAPLSGSGTSISHLAISSVDATNSGVVPLSGTPATNQYLQTTTAGVVSWNSAAGIYEIGITIDGNGAVLTTGSKGYRYISKNTTILSWTLVCDSATGSIVIDVKRGTYGGFPITSSICDGHYPTLTTQQSSQDTNLSDWSSVALLADDIVEFYVNSCTVATRVTLTLKVTTA